jgi:hypothetical protein
MKKLIILLLVFLYSQTILAQTTALSLPINYKIDGDATEWNNTFSINNKAIGISYSIANDKEKLYVIVHAESSTVINKIINNGLSFYVNDSKNLIGISYPIYPIGVRPLYLPLSKKQNTNQFSAINDSLQTIFNAKITENFKNIGVSGLSNITDSLVSIYNPEGIRIAAKFDSQLFLNIEIGIPIQLIGIENKLDFKIQLNGVPGKVEVIKAAGGDRIAYLGKYGVMYGLGLANPENYALAYPTELTGTIILNKIP